jgi:hypothetical protein
MEVSKNEKNCILYAIKTIKPFKPFFIFVNLSVLTRKLTRKDIHKLLVISIILNKRGSDSMFRWSLKTDTVMKQLPLDQSHGVYS